MNAVTVRIEEDLAKRLNLVAKHFERSKNHILKKALEEYVLDLEEEIEDYNDAVEVLNDPNSKVVDWEDVKRHCGLEN